MRLCSRSSRGDRWEGSQVTLNIPSAPATEQPLTPSITSTHSLEHTIWPCILSQDDFRHTYITAHLTVSPGQKQDSQRSKSMLYFMHKTQGFENDTTITSFLLLNSKGLQLLSFCDKRHPYNSVSIFGSTIPSKRRFSEQIVNQCDIYSTLR